jgi:hypothetical protein
MRRTGSALLWVRLRAMISTGDGPCYDNRLIWFSFCEETPLFTAFILDESPLLFHYPAFTS